MSKALPETKSEDDDVKNRAINLISNIKLLCFIKLEKVKTFFKTIKDEYGSEFKTFIKYF